MKTRPLGKTGVEVSAMCLGAMYFGSRNDRQVSYRILDRYMGAGGNFIDTANIYSHWVEGFKGGESETLLGEWMRERGNRQDVFIASKVGFHYGDVPKRLTASLIIEECDKSLARLGIDTIDLYYAHVDDYETPLEETMEAFNRLVTAGKVRFIGASNYQAWRLEEARWISKNNGWAEFCCVQQHYTYLQLRPGMSVAPQAFANEDLRNYLAHHDMAFMAYSVLQSGGYTRPDRPLRNEYGGSDNAGRLEELRAVAAEIGAPVNQVILAWMMQSTPPAIPLIAASSEEQLDENLGALNLTLTADQMTRLNAAGTA
jgi:aryl-alcohol dehydrogenase-like predicted oxidoreductase